MEAKNLEYHYDSGKDEEVKESELDLDRCVNHIIIKPEVCMNVTIEGLETSMFVETDDQKDNENNECVKDHENCNCVNHIVIKPNVTFDINISELTTLINS
ncbi:MAG: hypothetical protein MJA31_06760 [Clostridia bacterium]|nr:hypothetical protein [Clostridia bacterium]